MIADKQLEVDFLQTVLSVGEDSPGRLNAELASETIRKEHFTNQSIWRAYSAAKELARQGHALDIVLMSNQADEGDRGFIGAHWPQVPRYSGLRTLSQKLRHVAARRAAATIGKRIVEAAESGESFGQSLVDAAAALQSAYASDGSGLVSGHEVLQEFYEEIEKAQSESGYSHSIKTGIARIDESVGGLPRKFLSIIGAYPGCFKSGIMATVAANSASSGRRVGFFSLEDNPSWVAKRYVSRETGIPVEDISRRKLSLIEMSSLGRAADVVQKIMGNIFFDGRSGLTGIDVASSARYMIAEKKCELIVIDHCGEMAAQERVKERHDLEVTKNVKAIRDVAKETGVAILMAAHLKRRGDGGEDIHRPPTMTDFADSSSIEKMCRLAMGLWQPTDNDDEVAIKVLKQNEGGGRGKIFRLTKDKQSALVLND